MEKDILKGEASVASDGSDFEKKNREHGKRSVNDASAKKNSKRKVMKSFDASSQEAKEQDSVVAKEPAKNKTNHHRKFNFSGSKNVNQGKQERVTVTHPSSPSEPSDSFKDFSEDPKDQFVEEKPRASIEVQTLKNMGIKELIEYAKTLGVENVAGFHKQEIIFKILEVQSEQKLEIFAEGVLERLQEGYGFLRSSKFNYTPGPDDIYISPVFIKKFGLRTGDWVRGSLRSPRDGEKYFGLQRIESVNLKNPYDSFKRTLFENLTAIHPTQKFILDGEKSTTSTRILDLLCPIGKGQRGLIVAPPKTGKTVFLKDLANAIIANNPGTVVIILLVDERPEEVTDMQRSVNAEVVSSTFDEYATRHIQVSEMVLEKAKRLVECGHDVVIMLDSITRLARAYNTMAPPSGKVLSGGIDANALHRPKRFFGAARNVEEGGSLTIIATALIDTGSKMDEVIFEEFKSTGNMEIRLSRKLAERRIYPGVDIHMSSTRRDELLVTEERLNNMWILQRFLSSMNTIEAMEFLIEKINKTKDNSEFWELMNKKKVDDKKGVHERS